MAKITDLTNTTWVVPAGWSATAGLVQANITGSVLCEDVAAYPIDLNTELGNSYTFAIGYGPRNSTPMADRIYFNTSAYGDPYSGSLDSSCDFTITITGGADATNPALIAWLEANGELQGADEPEEPEVPSTGKVNVTFNGATYSIDTSALASAATTLKTHLTSNMSGTGATIKLGGVSYNIDATKLATARTKFVTHLGSISGSGAKVSVGGVEYSVDAGKLNAAADSISGALGKLENGGFDVPATIPENATYTIAETGEVLTTGDMFPEVVAEGDLYTYGDYKYTYTSKYTGWGVELNTDVTNKRQKTYGAMLDSINDIDVTYLDGTFYECTSLTTAPRMPSGTRSMWSTFLGCTSLKTYVGAPEGTPDGDFSGYVIPDTLQSMNGMFYNCTSLTKAPTIPESVTCMDSTFRNCTSLTDSITINGTPTSYDDCFLGVDMTNIFLTGNAPFRVLNVIGATGEHWRSVNIKTPDGLISFTISGTTYQVKNGMTWLEWIASEYNIEGFTCSGPTEMVFTADGSQYVGGGGFAMGGEVILLNRYNYDDYMLIPYSPGGGSN